MWSPKLYVRYHGNRIYGRGYQLPLISIKPIFERSRRRRLLATKLAILIQLKVVYMKVSGRTSSLLQYSYKMPKIINIGQRWDITHATEATPTTSFFQKVLVFSDGKQSFKPCPIVLFGVLLLRLDKNSSHTHGRHYRVERSLELEALNR